MIRAFETHRIRKTRELSSSLWDFHTLPDDCPSVSFPIAVPGCWETYPQTRTYRGKASYEKQFEAGGHIRLVFEGVSHTADVFLDGQQVASHYNAYTPFDAVIPDLKKGRHSLKVLVDNAYGPGSTLHIPNDYQTYGGISRGVTLEFLQDAFISGLYFTPVRTKEEWHGNVEITVQNLLSSAFSGTLDLMLGDQAIVTKPVDIPACGRITLLLPDLLFPDVQSWSPDTPSLYLLSAVLKDPDGTDVDDLIERIGFRDVKTEGDRILLNGQRILFKGFCRHEDHPEFGCAIPFQTMYRDLSMIRELGANSIRTVHYPNDRLFLDLCDELGLLVWEEGHARALTEEQMKNPLFMQQSTECIREMITAHYNHPSIIIWGFLNECASDTPFGKTCYLRHRDLVRELDPNRPCSFATCHKMTDLSLGLPDIVSFNIYPEWYEEEPASAFLDRLIRWVDGETEGAGKPFLITETGAGAIYGYRDPAHVKWSEEYQADALRSQLRSILSNERCSGVFIWQFSDVRVSGEWFFSRPRTMNNKGVVDEYRRPKLSYEVVKELFVFPHKCLNSEELSQKPDVTIYST